MIDMIRVSDGAQIGISEWDFGPNVPAQAVHDVIAEVLLDDPPYICRHHAGGDPLAIRLLMPFAADDQDWVQWESSFSHLIDQEMSTPKTDDERTNLIELRDALLSHAEKINGLLSQAKAE